jgi:uncharacterized protein DUF3592
VFSPLVILLATVALMTGGIVLVVVLSASASRARQSSTGPAVAVQARIVAVSFQGGSGAPTMYWPQVTYYGPNGAPLTARVERAVPYQLTVGQEVIVAYDPANPTRVWLAS